MAGPIVIKQWAQPISGDGIPTSAAQQRPAQQTRQPRQPDFIGEGLRVRFAKIPHVTPAGLLDAPVYLPAALNTVTLSETANLSEYETISDGQFSQAPGGGTTARDLRTLPIDALILDYDAPWLVAAGQDPVHVRQTINNILRSKKPVELLMAFQPGFEVELKMFVTMRQLTTDIRQGERDTRYITVSLTEWRDPSAARRSSQSSRKRGVRLPTTHVLKASDTLDSLAMEFYGAYEHWRSIRDANGISKRFGQGSALAGTGGPFKVGHKVKIPAVSLSGPSLGTEVAGPAV